jgi:hypothetical protein
MARGDGDCEQRETNLNWSHDDSPQCLSPPDYTAWERPAETPA